MTLDAGQPELAVVILAWNKRENLELLLPALREAAANIRRLELGDTGSGVAPQTPRSREEKGS